MQYRADTATNAHAFAYALTLVAILQRQRRMRNIILILILQSFFCCECKSQADSLQFVKLTFSGFKTPTSIFEINFRENRLHLLQYYSYTKDTVCNKDYTFAESDIKILKQILYKNAPTGLLEKREMALDGGGFVIFYKKANSDTSKLLVRNPERTKKYEKEYSQIDNFFDFAYSIVRDSVGESALDNAYERYYDKLPIRKIGDNPLEYKIWGNISGCREDSKELVDFFKNLPADKCVIVDIGNRNLSYCLTEVVVEQLQKQKLFIVSGDYLNWLSKELTELRTQVRDAESKGSQLKESPSNAVFLGLYLRDRKILDKWLDLPNDNYTKTRNEIIKNCH
jgi:hypothetical protein